MKRVIVFVRIGDELVRLSGRSFRKISSDRMMHERRVAVRADGLPS